MIREPLCTPLAKQLLELFRIDSAKKTTQRIVARHAIGKGQILSKKLLALLGKLLDVTPTITSCNHPQLSME